MFVMYLHLSILNVPELCIRCMLLLFTIYSNFFVVIRKATFSLFFSCISFGVLNISHMYGVVAGRMTIKDTMHHIHNNYSNKFGKNLLVMYQQNGSSLSEVERLLPLKYVMPHQSSLSVIIKPIKKVNIKQVESIKLVCRSVN